MNTCDNNDEEGAAAHNSNNSDNIAKLKEALYEANKGKGAINLRNEQNNINLRNHHTVAAVNPVPKLDFKRLKTVKEFRDWYSYASKLEDSVKFLRIRIRQFEDDSQLLN